MDPNHGRHRPVPSSQMPLQETENQIQRAHQVSCTPGRDWAGRPESPRTDFGLLTHAGLMPSPSWKRRFLQNQGHRLSEKPGVDRAGQMWAGLLGMPDTSLRPGCPISPGGEMKQRDGHESSSTLMLITGASLCCCGAGGILGHLGSYSLCIPSLRQLR